ncbi:hypothetical protein CBS101457_003040 [Exobasidium rhododendri]|nr:hypothetical protein CBS101457_003040 [Exobasidium rhododendri]
MPAGRRWTALHFFADRVLHLKGKHYANYSTHYEQMRFLLNALPASEKEFIPYGSVEDVEALAREVASRRKARKSKSDPLKDFAKRVLMLNERVHVPPNSHDYVDINKIAASLSSVERDIVLGGDDEAVETLARKIARKNQKRQKSADWKRTVEPDAKAKLELLVKAMFGDNELLKSRILRDLGEDRGGVIALIEVGDIEGACRVIGKHKPRVWAKLQAQASGLQRILGEYYDGLQGLQRHASHSHS